MMRADALNWRGYPVRTEITDLSFHVFSTDKDESKRIIVHETLFQSCSGNEDKSKHIIVNKNLLQNCSSNKDELCSMEEDKSEWIIT